MMKSNIEKSVVTSFQWHHPNCGTEKRHQNNVTKCFHFGPPIHSFRLRQCPRHSFSR